MFCEGRCQKVVTLLRVSVIRDARTLCFARFLGFGQLVPGFVQGPGGRARTKGTKIDPAPGDVENYEKRTFLNNACCGNQLPEIS